MISRSKLALCLGLVAVVSAAVSYGATKQGPIRTALAAAVSTADAAETPEMARRLIGKTFAVRECNGSATYFGPDVVASLVSGGQVFSASKVEYVHRGELLEVHRDHSTMVEVYDFPGDDPMLMRMEVAGVAISPPPGTPAMHECRGAHTPDAADLAEQMAPDHETPVETGAFMAMMMKDERAVREFKDKGVDFSEVYDKRPLTYWAGLSTPAILKLVSGTDNADRYDEYRDGGRPWVRVDAMPSDAIGVFSRICRMGGIGIGPHRYIRYDDKPPQEIRFSEVWQSGRRYRIHAPGETIQIYETGFSNGVRLKAVFLESGAPMPMFKEADLPRCS